MLSLLGDPKQNQEKVEVNLHIYDARPYINAVGNQFAGKGYESD